MTDRNRDAAESNSRNIILGVATRLFAEKPYDAVVIRDIARLANVKSPTIYYFFKSKTGLYRAAVLTYYQSKIARLASLPGPDSPPAARIHALVLQQLQALANDETFFQLLLRELLSADEAFKKELAETLMVEIYDYLGEALASTRFGRGNTTLPALIMSMILGYFQVARFQKYLPGQPAGILGDEAALRALADTLTALIV